MDGGLIIAEGNDGLTSKRTDVGEYVQVSHMPRELEVGVGDVALGIGGGHETRPQHVGELPPPGDARAGIIRREPHATHTTSGGIVCADERDLAGEEFVKVCGTRGHGARQVEPIGQFALDGRGDTDSLFVGCT